MAARKSASWCHNYIRAYSNGCVLHYHSRAGPMKYFPTKLHFDINTHIQTKTWLNTHFHTKESLWQTQIVNHFFNTERNKSNPNQTTQNGVPTITNINQTFHTTPNKNTNIHYHTYTHTNLSTTNTIICTISTSHSHKSNCTPKTWSNDILKITFLTHIYFHTTSQTSQSYFPKNTIFTTKSLQKRTNYHILSHQKEHRTLHPKSIHTKHMQLTTTCSLLALSHKNHISPTNLHPPVPIYTFLKLLGLLETFASEDERAHSFPAAVLKQRNFLKSFFLKCWLHKKHKMSHVRDMFFRGSAVLNCLVFH